MNLNEKAIEAFVNNDYENALLYFEKAVSEEKNIQSLNNLAWFLLHIEGEDTKALDLLKECIKLNPSSHFPYSTIGEIYLNKEQWLDAKKSLLTANKVKKTKTNYFNLGVAYFHLGNKETASKYFNKVANGSDYSTFLYVKCLIDCGQRNKAKIELNKFNQDSDEFVGEIEIAELYYELSEYEKAAEWFEEGLKTYYKSEDWLKTFIFSLLKLERKERANEIMENVINEKETDLESLKIDVDFTEYWTEKDKTEDVKALQLESNSLKELMKQIALERKPTVKFSISNFTDCYLFGCTKCGHPEYKNHS